MGNFIFWGGCILFFLFGCGVISSITPDKRIQYVAHNLPVKITQTHMEDVRFDTTRGFVTYIDTSLNQGNGILWMKGYEVTTADMVGTIHVAFLDENLKPIKYKGLGLIK